MRRWQLTAVLTSTALAAGLIAPRLEGLVQRTTTAPVPIELPSSAPLGHLTLEAGLDHNSVVAGSGDVRFLVVTVTAPEELGVAVRRAVDLSVVIDTSGSMAERGKIDYARRATKMLASQMHPGDRFSVVTFSDHANRLISSEPVTDVSRLHKVIDGIYEGGGTNLYAGMEMGGQEVTRSLAPGRVGRVVLLSDGHANVGLTDPTALTQYASVLAQTGISVSAIGLGLDYNEDMLADIADLGGGRYDFVDNPRGLSDVFTTELSRTAAVVATDVEIDLRLPEGVEGLGVIGWDATPSSSGWSIRLGDIVAGEQRKVVVRLRVNAGQQGPIEVANLVANYTDLVDGQSAQASTQAHVQVTQDARAAALSINDPLAVMANQAWGNWFLDQSARSYANGDVDESSEYLRQGNQVLYTASIDLNSSLLGQEAQELAEQAEIYKRYAPASSEGKRAIKSNKQRFREVAR
ncbi:MAG: VWA domain-containing protein [Rhodobacterales bacterium]|nr:VWA domain-containing protein [Rhodobacterales bacterium]